MEAKSWRSLELVARPRDWMEGAMLLRIARRAG